MVTLNRNQVVSLSEISKIATERLKEIDPESYEKCEKLVKAPLNDLALLPSVLTLLTKMYEPTPENSPLILAVVYYLYAPYKLYFETIRAENGIRSMLCEAFNWKDTPTVNYYIKIMVVYYKNPRWAAKIREIADEILKSVLIKTNFLPAMVSQKRDKTSHP